MSLFRKSEIWLFKVYITGRIIFSEMKTFLFFSILLKKDFVNPHKISAHSDHFYFSEPMLLIKTCFCSQLCSSCFCTGKSMSEALIFQSTNPQYDNRLSVELPVQYMKMPSLEHGENMMRTLWKHDEKMLCTQIVFCFSFRTTYVHNMFYPPIFSPMFWAWNFYALNW